jgi:ubiquinone/menaquinone biosynthesis C-methylase UbiE
MRPVIAGEQPGRPPACVIAYRPDHDIVVIDGFDELVKRGAECSRDRDQLVESDSAVPGLDSAQGRGAQEAASGEGIQRPSPGEPQAFDPLADETVEVEILRHKQDPMPSAHHHRKVERMEHHHGHLDNFDSAAELLDLDGEVLHAYLSEASEWVWERAAATPRRRILDLGAGTGTGSIALAQLFVAADVIAVDSSEELLARIRDKAQRLGLAERIRTVQVDLDAAWPSIDAVGTVDVVWASLSLHHLADPDQALGRIFATLAPGGVVAVAEMESMPRFLPDDIGLGRPGLESRCHEALAQERAQSLPHLGSDWGPRLEQAGFSAVAKRIFVLDVGVAESASTGRFAHAFLARIRPAVEGRLSADDLDALDRLLAEDGPEGILHRNDLIVRGSRTVWIGHRP